MDKHSKQALDRAMYVAKVLGYHKLRAVLSLCLKGTRAEALETLKMLDRCDVDRYMKMAIEDAESLLFVAEKKLSDERDADLCAKRIAKLQPGEKIGLNGTIDGVPYHFTATLSHHNDDVSVFVSDQTPSDVVLAFDRKGRPPRGSRHNLKVGY